MYKVYFLIRAGSSPPPYLGNARKKTFFSEGSIPLVSSKDLAYTVAKCFVCASIAECLDREAKEGLRLDKQGLELPRLMM